MSEKHIDIATKEYADQIGSKIDSHVIQKGNPHNMTPIDIGAQPNQNMLDNWYFGNPVNRNGLSEYTGLQNKVSIDRWMMSDENLKLTINSDHVTFTNQGICTGYFYQYLDTSFDLLNLPITLSCLTAEGEVYTGNTTITDITPDNPNMVTFPITDYLDFGIGYFVDTQKWAFIFRCHDAEHATTINIVAAKIEYGNIQTLAAKNVEDEWMLCELPKSAEEVTKCIQYNATTGEYLGLVPEAIGAATPEYIESKIEEVTTTLTDDISTDISSHDSSSTAHTDIRNLVRSLTEGVTSHTTNNNNPHGITADQIGAFAKVTGLTGQLLGFTDTNIIGAVDVPSGGGKCACEIVIGTSTEGWTENDCDYLCDGTDDGEEFNQALRYLCYTMRLSTGGTIRVLRGVYNFIENNCIKIDGVGKDFTLIGSGNSTIFRYVGNGNSTMITVNSNGTTLCDFTIDMNSQSTNNNSYAIHIRRTSRVTVKNTTILNVGNTAAIYLSGSSSAYTNDVVGTDTHHNTIISNKIICYRGYYGINLSQAKYNIISSNFVEGYWDYGINIGYQSAFNTVIGNVLYGVHYDYSGKTMYNGDYGIHLASTSSNTSIVGNICTGNKTGICINGGNCNIIIGNTCDDNLQYGLHMYQYTAKRCIFIGNSCNNNSYCGLYSSGCTASECIVLGNSFANDDGYTSISYAAPINLDSNTSKFLIAYNNFKGKSPSISGSGHIIENNLTT